jgi:hypothetical protein
MSKVSADPSLPAIVDSTSASLEKFKYRLTLIFREHASQLNSLSEGRVGAVTNATTAAPTTGTYAQGDFVRNSTPSELGAAASKYIIHGWQCTVSGTPGTWVQCRYLTGN